MKLSQFNITSQENENKYILYNTFSTGLVTLDKDTYEKVIVNKDFADFSGLPYLVENGFVVEDDCDEVAKVEAVRTAIMKKTIIQNIVILTTTDCNARCYYCFEHGIDHVYMSKETADGIVEYCKKKYKEKRIAITWFGGEPLMNYDIIKYITFKLIEAGYELECHVTTNGSLVTDEMIDFFEKNYVRFSFQITIDSVHDEYSKVKRYVDIEPEKAYDRTINNVIALIKRGVRMMIRVNFASSKIEHAKEVYKTLIDTLSVYDLAKVNIYMAPLSLPGDKEIISNFHGDIEHPFLQMVKVQREEGFPLHDLYNEENEISLLSAYNLQPSAISCGMNLACRIVVNADGTLYKCHRLVGKKEFAVGNVFDGEDESNPHLKYFHDIHVTDEDCRKCDILPICQMGCSYSRFTYGKQQKCSRIRQVKSELVQLYYHALLEEQNK